MKFSLAFLSLAATVGASSSLRKSGGNHASLESKVLLKGAVGEPTDKDLDFIGKAFVASYNDIHWEVGHLMTGDHSIAYEGLGQQCNYCHDDDATKGAFVFNVKTTVGQQCNYCHDDDATFGGLLTTALVEDCAGMCNKKADAQLEASFCNKIASSGSDFLKSVSQCGIAFDVEGSKKTKHTPTAAVAAVDSTLILKGISGESTSKTELALIAKAFVSAYNDVHWDDKFHLSGAEVAFSAGTPVGQQCNYCHDDDASFGSTLVLDIVTPVVPVSQQCNYCHDDDASADLTVALKSDAASTKAVAAAFCKKIQSSVSAKLSGIQSCTVAMESVLAIGN